MRPRLYSLLAAFALSTGLLTVPTAVLAQATKVVPGPVDKDAPQAFLTTESGLKYRVLRKSSGDKPSPRDKVKVHYRGTLVQNGKEFDSSYARGKPTTFALNAVIPGWTEGVQLVGKGGMIELEVPSELGYGAGGQGAIPPNAALRFLVELIDFQPAPPLPKPGPVDVDAAKEFTTTASGLKYRVLRKSKEEKTKASDLVILHYRGWIPDPQNPAAGREFDNSYERGQPAVMPVAGMGIAGWAEGVQLIGRGGMIELEIPPHLGFGEKEVQGIIPPNTTLRFVLELLPFPKPGPADKEAPAEFTTTKSGLKYRVLRKSDGPKATRTSAVRVHYRGWLPDAKDPGQGAEFDSSYARGEPIEFPLGNVIPGWTEGMQLVGEGGMIELEVPPALGYGAKGAGDTIPPNATLRFLVELLEVIDN